MIRVISAMSISPYSEYIVENNGKIPNISCDKAAIAGMTLRYTVQETLLDTVQYFIDHSLIDVSTDRNTSTASSSSSCSIS